MKAIKITDLASHPISYTEFAGRVIFGGRVPTRFEPGNSYNSGDYAYLVNDGELEVWRCTQRGTYLEITSVSWVRATIPNIVADLLKYLDIMVPDSDADYDTMKCFDCRTLFTTIKSGNTNIPVTLSKDMRLNPQLMELFVDGLFFDRTMYTISDNGKVVLNTAVSSDKDVVIIYRDPMNSIAGLIDCCERTLTNIEGFSDVYPLPDIPLYTGSYPDYTFYVDGKLLPDTAYEVMTTDDLEGYTGSYEGTVIKIAEFITISGELDSFDGDLYVSKTILKPDSKVVCRIIYSASSKMDVMSMNIPMSMNTKNKYKFNIYDSFYYNEDDEIVLMTDKYGPITQKELSCTDTTLTITNEDKPLNNSGGIETIMQQQTRLSGTCNKFIKNFTGPDSDGSYYTLFNNSWCKIANIGNVSFGAASLGITNNADSSGSFVLSNNETVYIMDSDDGNSLICTPYLDTGDMTNIIDLGIPSADISKKKYAAIVDDILYVFISGTQIRKVDLSTGIVTIDDASLQYDFMDNGCYNLVVIDGIIYGITSVTSDTMTVLAINSKNLSSQNIITINFTKYTGSIFASMCVLNHILYIYLDGANILISYSPKDNSYSTTNYAFDIGGDLSSLYYDDFIHQYLLEDYTSYECILMEFNNELGLIRQCDVAYSQYSFNTQHPVPITPDIPS